VDVAAAAVTVSGAMVTIDLSTTLVENTGYYVQVDAGAFADLAINYFAGISDTTTWNFSTVENVAPVITSISNSSPGVGDAAGGQEVTFDAQFTDVNTLDNHTAVIDWGDGTITSGQVIESNGSGSVFGSHIYIDGGIYNITLTLMDDHGGLATGMTTAVITGVRLDNGVLQIIGTKQNDHVTVNMSGSRHSNKQFEVHANFLPSHGHKCHWYKPERGYKTFDAADINKIVVLVGDGNDKVTIAGNVRITSLIDGGAGNDKLKGGAGADIILGAEGNDMLIGGRGRDILIGGDGCDRIIGNSGDDILIGGTTSFDIDDSNLDLTQLTLGQSFDEALRAILAEWNSQRSFCKRVKNLKNGSGSDDRLNGPFFLQRGITVFDDSDRDCMTGSRGKDWFISFDGDKLTDNKNKDNGNCQHQYQCSIWKLLTRL
jgi:Ca2+-binding RTX toxin-like protein